MKKVLFASMNKKEDILAWSGTNYSMYNVLTKEYEVKYIYVHSFLASFFRRMFNTIKLEYFAELLFSYFISKKFDILIKNCQEDYVVCICASKFLAYSKTNKKIIYISDATYHLMFEYYINGLNKRISSLYDKIEKAAIEKSYRIIYSNHWASEDAISHYNADYNKIIIEKFGSNIEDKFDKNVIYDTIKDKVDLLIVGVDFKRKGIDVAIKTTKKLAEADDKHKYVLHIVGIDTTKVIDYLGIEVYNESLSFCKYYNKLYKNIENDLYQLIDLYRKSHFFILPTRAECSAIVYSESAMYGLPIITRNTGGVTDYVIDGLNGYALPYNSDENEFAKIILDIINDKEKYKDLRINSRHFYDKELNWLKWEGTFKRIIG